MATAQQDTEITLGMGRMLAIFFTLVLVCALFFSIGFSLGRRTSMAVGSGLLSAPSGATSTAVRPSAVKGNGGAASAGAQSGDFSFYKAVGEKNADSALAPKDSKAQSAAAGSPPSASGTSTKAATDSGNTAGVTATASSSGTYYVQVAAVSRQEDAESLVEALKKKQ